MKLLKDSLYLTKLQWRKLFLATTIMVVALYIVAMVFSLCGSKYFILNYQNEQMDKIEAWFRNHHMISVISWAFSTIEFFIVTAFIIKKLPKWYYVLAFYLPIAILAPLVTVPHIIYYLYPFAFYLLIPLFEGFKKKNYLFCLIRLVIAVVFTYIYQFAIYVIKTGNFSFANHDMTLSANFCYALEYDIALGITLFTIGLFSYREKGDSKVWTTHLGHGGFSQTSKKQLLKSKTRKTLTKTQRSKIRLFYLRLYLVQLGGFLLLMVLPFVLGKLFEFLMMYLAFALARYLLGFKYSLHFKKETLCITVGAVVFGILSLAVPFFYVVVIMAILLGVGLAVLLHLSYKYKGMFLFNKIAKPDKYAELYVIFDGNLDRHHVQIMCLHKGLDKEMTEIVCDYTDGNKKSYIAKKSGYEVKTIERKINEAIEILKANS